MITENIDVNKTAAAATSFAIFASGSNRSLTARSTTTSTTVFISSEAKTSPIVRIKINHSIREKFKNQAAAITINPKIIWI